ncbi:MAG: acetylglutamate kinase [Kiritimatiellia bacterium]
MQEYIEKANVLIEAVPYIQEFRGCYVVVKLGGSVMESKENLLRLMSDIAFMRTVGIKVILVHGGGKAINRAMEAAHLPPNFVQGLRVSDEPTLEIVESVLKHEVNANILKLLNNNFHVLARPLHGDWILTVRKTTGSDAAGQPIDWGYVGDPTAVKSDSIMQMADAGVIPVITPLGLGDEDGKLYNVNADVAAVAIAKAMRVQKLIFISDVPGLLRDVEDPKSLLSTLRLGDVRKLKEEGVIRGGMLPKIDSCAEAIEAGVQRVHLIDGRMPHSLLLEIFTKQGVGTEIKADE